MGSLTCAGGICNAVFFAGHLITMSPLAFLARPMCWLEAISQYKATHTASPDFGYALVTRKSGPEHRRAPLDLSCLKVWPLKR